MKREEELEAIKRLSPEVVLGDLGIEAKRAGHRLCIPAPWREETKPSVFIEQKSNGHYVWKDFGNEKGGSWIDFFMKLYGWDYVQAVKYLRERYLGTDIDPVEVKKSSKDSFSFGSRKYELEELKTKKVEHPTLLEYLRKRGITKKAPSWLKEVYYSLMNKETGEVKKYFALGVQTLSGSWILRNSLMKMNLRTSDNQEHTFALIRNSKKKLIIVEGLFDALSVHQIARRRNFDLLILSGVGNIKKLLKSEILACYDDILIATDKDEAGEQAFREIFAFLCKSKREQSIKRITFNGRDLNEAIIKSANIKIVDFTKKVKKV